MMPFGGAKAVRGYIAFEVSIDFMRVVLLAVVINPLSQLEA
jgi:hypothetical protein